MTEHALLALCKHVLELQVLMTETVHAAGWRMHEIALQQWQQDCVRTQ